MTSATVPAEKLVEELLVRLAHAACPAGRTRADWQSLLAPSAAWRRGLSQNPELLEGAAKVVDAVVVDGVVQLLGATQEGGAPEGWQQGHIRRSVVCAGELAAAAGLSPAGVRAVRWGAALHDIGKARVPQAILQKPGPLSPQEYRVVCQHPEWGAELLGSLRFLPAQTLAAVRHHHERWDGQGYPARLRRRRIPQSARIVALADVYDALTSERPYKAAWSGADAARYLLREAGRQFDPRLTRLFVREVLGFQDLTPCVPCAH